MYRGYKGKLLRVKKERPLGPYFSAIVCLPSAFSFNSRSRAFPAALKHKTATISNNTMAINISSSTPTPSLLFTIKNPVTVDTLQKYIGA